MQVHVAVDLSFVYERELVENVVSLSLMWNGVIIFRLHVSPFRLVETFLRPWLSPFGFVSTLQQQLFEQE